MIRSVVFLMFLNKFINKIVNLKRDIIFQIIVSEIIKFNLKPPSYEQPKIWNIDYNFRIMNLLVFIMSLVYFMLEIRIGTSFLNFTCIF